MGYQGLATRGAGQARGYQYGLHGLTKGKSKAWPGQAKPWEKASDPAVCGSRTGKCKNSIGDYCLSVKQVIVFSLGQMSIWHMTTHR